MRKYGWIPDIGDKRDKILKLRANVALPPSVDMRNSCSPSENQGATGSCVGQACVSAIEELDNKDKEYTEASALFVYYTARAIRGWETRDEGAIIRDAIKAMAGTGVASQIKWPFSESKVNEKPSDEAYEDGKKKVIGDYYRIDGPNKVYEMKYALAAGYPVVFGISIYQSFESDFVKHTGIVPIPLPSERLLGGHAIKAVGYNDLSKWFICQNSWGTFWGVNGFFYLPYAYVADDNLATDFWVITKGGFDDGHLEKMTWLQRFFAWVRVLFI